uniref:General transcription factor IIIC subunit 5 n=1 Tax=Pundamilia nyererei TaxID=303518 RepID=A0A3B4GQC0_9CICH
MADMRDAKLDFTLKELTFPAEHEDVPGSSSTVELQDKKLVCVEYPGVFSSADRMLATLGGEPKVTKTYSNPSKRLELRYRPQDPFCHSLYGNRVSSGNLLLRVRRRARKNDPKDAEIHMDMLGVIGTTYKFMGLADFQCLAVHSEGGKHTPLYDKIILRKPESQEFFEQPMPYFLPPPIFSRLDSPVDYFYRPDVHLNKNFIGLNRAGRPHNAIFVSFTDPVVPAECLEAAKVTWKRICMNECDKKAEEQLKKMFESRPIWSRNAVKANINLHPDKLKLLLPFYAYYMVTGPWRSLWVKLGYDPRKTPEAKKYQMLDFRIRCSSKHGYLLSNIPIKAKRSSLNYSLPNTLNKSVMEKLSVSSVSSPQESSYIFREGMLPPHRQMFYQVCDLDVESIQKEIEQNNGNEQHCDERDGWCVVGTTDKLRDMISAMIKAVIRAQKPSQSVKDVYAEEEEDAVGEYENREDEEEDEEDEFQPSEGSENEMETEILDYM